MIQIKSVQQTIQLRGITAPTLTVATTPKQTIKLVSSGPRGPQGEQGPVGLSGSALIPAILDGGNF